MLLALAMSAATAHAGFGGTPGLVNEDTPHYDLKLLYHDGKAEKERAGPVLVELKRAVRVPADS